MQRNLLIALAVIAMLVGAIIFFNISTLGIYEQGWDVHPSGGSGAKPTFVDPTGPDDRWIIGHHGGNNGAAGSAISQDFDCGDNEDRYCTVTFQVLGVTVATGEKPYVYLNSGGTSSTKRIPASPDNSPREHKLSVQGCREQCEVKFGIEGTSRTARIGSAIVLTSVNTKCLIGDQTTESLTSMAAN